MTHKTNEISIRLACINYVHLSSLKQSFPSFPNIMKDRKLVLSGLNKWSALLSPLNSYKLTEPSLPS